MNRPDNGNALNMQLAVDLLDAADRVSEDAAVRAVLLTGAGKSGFGAIPATPRAPAWPAT